MLPMDTQTKRQTLTSPKTFRNMRLLEEINAWAFVTPAVIGVIFLQVFPTLFSLVASLTDWNLISSPNWVGLNNYLSLFKTDPFFGQTLRFTFIYSCSIIFIAIPLSLFIALMLNQKIVGKTFFRLVLFLPVIIPTASAALAWRWMYEPTSGILNQILRAIGLAPVPWLTNTHTAIWGIIIEAIWANLGLNVVIFLAGLQNISQVYYEAAEIDGAGDWQKFRHITLPLLSPTTFFVLVIGVINALQAFDIPYIMTNGGPANSTQTVVMYLYTNAFRLQRMGLASAIGYLVFIIILVLTFLNFRLEKKWVFYEEAE